jgi:hypothetical protein
MLVPHVDGKVLVGAIFGQHVFTLSLEVMTSPIKSDVMRIATGGTRCSASGARASIAKADTAFVDYRAYICTSATTFAFIGFHRIASDSLVSLSGTGIEYAALVEDIGIKRRKGVIEWALTVGVKALRLRDETTVFLCRGFHLWINGTRISWMGQRVHTRIVNI